MLQLLAQYQYYIYTIFITTEVLRYLYGVYTTWQANRTRIRRINAAIELFTEAYCTMVQVMIFKRFRPLGDKARIAFNIALQPNTDVTEGMWELINVAIENLIKQYGLLSDPKENNPTVTNLHKLYPEFYRMRRSGLHRNHDVPNFDLWGANRRQQEKENVQNDYIFQHQFNVEPVVADNIAVPESSPVPAQPEQPATSTVTEPTPVTDHPLQATTPVEKSIYEGMELTASKNNESSEPETVKRPRFGIASTNGLNTSK